MERQCGILSTISDPDQHPTIVNSGNAFASSEMGSFRSIVTVTQACSACSYTNEFIVSRVGNASALTALEVASDEADQAEKIAQEDCHLQKAETSSLPQRSSNVQFIQ